MCAQALQQVKPRSLDARWDKNEMLNKQQIGKCGELLVQYKLLLNGVESAHLTTDSGIDLVAYSLKTKEPITIQVKANLKAKPGGGKGKLALDWWVPEDSPAALVALADLSTNRVWLLNVEEISEFAQQHSSGQYHVYMYIDPTVKPSKAKRRVFTYEFEKFLLENRVHIYFE